MSAEIVTLPEFAEREQSTIITLDEMNMWQIPPLIQRELRVNKKMHDVAGVWAKNPCIPGVFLLGILRDDPKRTPWLYDGMHRRETAKLSGQQEFYAVVSIKYFNSLEEMAREALSVQEQLVRTQSDDKLHTMEVFYSMLRGIRECCPFIGYFQTRRGPYSPVQSMSIVVRAWCGSGWDNPTPSSKSAVSVIEEMTEESAKELVNFLLIAKEAWGTDVDSFPMWNAVNLFMCMYLWRRLVVDIQRGKARRYAVLSPNEFRMCLIAVLNNQRYQDWLSTVSRYSEQIRSPLYSHHRRIFIAQMKNMGKDIKMPKPDWWSGRKLKEEV